MLDNLVKKIIKREKRTGRIDVSLVNDRLIHQLNWKFRKKDRPTDVLSFAYPGEGILGDVIISRETTRRNAQKYGVSYGQEVKRLVIHGTLHVLGYDHGRKMSHAEEVCAKL